MDTVEKIVLLLKILVLEKTQLTIANSQIQFIGKKRKLWRKK